MVPYLHSQIHLYTVRNDDVNVQYVLRHFLQQGEGESMQGFGEES